MSKKIPHNTNRRKKNAILECNFKLFSARSLTFFLKINMIKNTTGFAADMDFKYKIPVAEYNNSKEVRERDIANFDPKFMFFDQSSQEIIFQ